MSYDDKFDAMDRAAALRKMDEAIKAIGAYEAREVERQALYARARLTYMVVGMLLGGVLGWIVADTLLR